MLLPFHTLLYDSLYTTFTRLSIKESYGVSIPFLSYSMLVVLYGKVLCCVYSKHTMI